MTQVERRRWLVRVAWLVGAGIGLGWLAASGAGEANKPGVPPGGPRVLFPPNHAVLLKGTFEVIVQGPPAELQVDGKPHAWDAYAPPVQVAKVGLIPGLHEIRVGNQRIEFSVGLSEDEHEGPKDWPVYRSHSISASRLCTSCHQTGQAEGKTVVGAVKDREACFECHRQAEFESVEMHSAKPLESCSSCHVLHASDRKGLRKPRDRRLSQGGAKRADGGLAAGHFTHQPLPALR